MAGEKSSAWLWGCGIGCLVSLVVLGAVIGGLAFMGYTGMKHAQPKMAQEFSGEYQKAIERAKATPEQRAVYDEVVQAATRPEVSFVIMQQVMILVLATTQDGNVSQDDLAAMEMTRDYLRAHPNPTLLDIRSFFESMGPAYQKVMRDKMPGQTTPPAETSATPPGATPQNAEAT